MENEQAKLASPLARLDLAATRLRPHWPFLGLAGSRTGRARSERHAASYARRAATGQPPIDVICAGMYRACSTWQYEVVAHLIEQFRGGKRLGYLTIEEYNALLRSDATDVPPAPEGSRLWRMIKSHDGHRSFARSLADGKALAVYAHRDVREVVFSLMHKRALSFDQLVRQGMIHQILENDRFWMRQPDVLVQRYDDLLADPVTGVKELAHHLGLPLSEHEAARIADLYSRESNRAALGSSGTPAQAVRRRPAKRRRSADLRSQDSASLEPHANKWRRIMAHDGHAARNRDAPSPVRGLAQGARLPLGTRRAARLRDLAAQPPRAGAIAGIRDRGTLELAGANDVATIPGDRPRRETHPRRADGFDSGRHRLVRPNAVGSRRRDDRQSDDRERMSRSRSDLRARAHSNVERRRLSPSRERVQGDAPVRDQRYTGVATGPRFEP